MTRQIFFKSYLGYFISTCLFITFFYLDNCAAFYGNHIISLGKLGLPQDLAVEKWDAHYQVFDPNSGCGFINTGHEFPISVLGNKSYKRCFVLEILAYKKRGHDFTCLVETKQGLKLIEIFKRLECNTIVSYEIRNVSTIELLSMCTGWVKLTSRHWFWGLWYLFLGWIFLFFVILVFIVEVFLPLVRGLLKQKLF